MPNFNNLQYASEPGSPTSPSEDWAQATADLIVVLDGATARTETGCSHGISWYAEHLGKSLLLAAADTTLSLVGVAKSAISRVACLHPECDLTHPGTPSAGIAMLRPDGRYFVLGDVAIVAESTDGIAVIVDERVSQTGVAERAEVDHYLIGTPEKAAALLPMKRAELAARNIPGGYWIAAADPAAADHALVGHLGLDDGAPVAVLTDGAARAEVFGLLDWAGLLDLAVAAGPLELIQRVRAAENSDPLGAKWPRNKASDDATMVTASVAS
ncbi:hypothetical protein F4553_003058 [Allocatelliglobosispora scoriae]|uniref:Integrase n=1 Tax=Allocatelliglobosispora scoriae TaxID=643052 RepID=A0A841BR58_9ACTN|nr:hypothetical protein [Allocatelliglobosispora scoriae]MBB5869679.1 hypothetical protein [Allocatelliglobosispora scoriae]